MGNYAKNFRSLLIGVYKKGIVLNRALPRSGGGRESQLAASVWLKAVKPARFFVLGLI